MFDGVGITAVLWWAFLVVIWRVHKRLVGNPGVTTFSIFLPYVFVTNGVLVPVANEIAYAVTGLDLAMTSYTEYWRSLALMYVAILVGIALANRYRPKASAAEPPILDDIDVVSNSTRTDAFVLFVLVICVISLIQIYGAGLSFDFYSFVTMNMDHDMYDSHRYGFGLATSGWEFFLYNKLPYGIAPVAIVLMWNARGVATSKRVLAITVMALALVQTGHKMPLIFLCATMVVSRYLIRRRLVLGVRTMLFCVGLLVVVALVILPAFYLMQGNETYSDSLFWSMERLFFEQQRTLQLHFEVYPNIHPFLHGASTGTIATLMGVTDFVPPSVYIPVNVLGLENTSFPSLFIGEGWADFGYLGVALTSVFVGFLLQLYNIWFYTRRHPHLEETATFLAVVFSAYHLLECNVLTSLFSYGIASSYFIYLLIRRRSPASSPDASSSPHLET